MFETKKKTTSRILALLLVFVLAAGMLPMNVFAQSMQITETTENYTGTLGYGGGIRKKSDGSIMFSPFITELKAEIDGGANLTDYMMEMTFTLLDGKSGSEVKTYNTVAAAINKSNGSYYDIFLNGTKGNCGFCPTAEAYYDIYVEIFKGYGTDAQELCFYGTYESIQAASAISESAYYAPTEDGEEPGPGDEPFESVQITETTDGYTGSKTYNGIRLNSSGNILFSPFITELYNAVAAGDSYSDYTILADFAVLADDGTIAYVYEDITLNPVASKGKYVDIPMMSNSVNCGFCPTAGKSYNIYMEIYKDNALCYYGEYKKVAAQAAIADSSYYAPTAVPGAPVEYDINLSYSFSNELAGSAAGTIYFETDNPGTFALYWGDAQGNLLTVTAGTKTLNYSALDTFTITDAEGGTYVEEVLGFTAIPEGAKYLVAADSAKNVLKTLEIPADKCLAETGYEYSFGVISDVHFNYFYDDAGNDCAVYAMDTALDFYEAVDAKLVAATGDYSLYAEEESYREFQAAVDASNMMVIACGGNHELYASIETMFGENGYWRTYMNNGIYDGTVDGVLDIADNGIDFTYRIPGVDDAVFVSLSQWYWDGHTASQEKLVEPQQLVWLEEQFETYKDETVYLLFHTYLGDDDGLSYDGEGDLINPGGYTYGGHYNIHTEDEKIFRNLLTEYDNVVWFNGHSHYEYSMQMFNDNLNIFDYEGTTATMIHVPSVTNMRTLQPSSTSYSSLKGKASQGALMFVYDGYEIMNGVDLWNDEILSYACYIVYDDKTDIVETETFEGTDITWTYDAQLNSLRILGTGKMPDFTAEVPYAQYAEDIYSVYVGRGITNIGDSAFAGLVNLEKAELKDGITSIGTNAFAAANIKELILPESLDIVEENAFAGVSSIEKISYGGSKEKWEAAAIGIGNDVLSEAEMSYDKVQVTFIAGDETYSVDMKVGEVPSYDGIPAKEHEDETKYYIFTGWSDGNKVYAVGEELPKVTGKVTYTAVFGSEAERYTGGNVGTSSVTWSMDLRDGVLTIAGEGVMPTIASNTEQPWYEYRNSIYKAVVNGSVTEIGKNAFCRIDALDTVVIEEGVKTLAMDALAYNNNLKTVYIPLSLKNVGQGTVYASNNIETIYYGGTVDEWNAFCASVTTPYNTNLIGAKNVICKPVVVAFAIVKQPKNVSAAKGNMAEVTVEATGEGLTYTWYYKNPGNVKFYKSGDEFVTGGGNTYSIPMYAWRDGQEVYCVVTNAEGETLQTNVAALTMEQEPVVVEITEQPEDVIVDVAGKYAVVNVEAKGLELTYEWYYKNPGNVKFYKSGEQFVNGNQYAISVASWRDGQQVYCVITDINGHSVQSNTVTLSIAK